MVCKNCANEFEGSYCNTCGQSSSVDRIDWKYLNTSLSQGIFQIDKGFFYTTISLFLRPGKSIKDFLAGQRVKLFKPFAFLLIMASLYLISHKFLDNKTFVDDFASGFLIGASDTSSHISENRLIDFLTNNQTYVFLFTVPLFSFAVYLLFMRSRYNLYELIIANLYIIGIQLFIYTVFSFISNRESAAIMLPIVLGFGYSWWTHNQLFNDQKWFARNVKLILAYCLYLVFLVLSSMLVMALTIPIFNSGS